MGWPAGLTVGLFGGLVIVRTFRRFTPPRQAKAKGGVPNWLTGLIERSFFIPVAAAGFANPNSGGLVVPAMLGWLTLKMAANWGRPIPEEISEQNQLRYKQRSIKALVSGLISMGAALIGGAIWAGAIPLGSFVCR